MKHLQLDAAKNFDKSLKNLCLQVVNFGKVNEKGPFHVTVLLSESDQIEHVFDCESVSKESVAEALTAAHQTYLGKFVEALEAVVDKVDGVAETLLEEGDGLGG